MKVKNNKFVIQYTKIIITVAEATGTTPNNANQKVTLKNCDSFAK